MLIYLKSKNARLRKCGWLGNNKMVSYRCVFTALKNAHDKSLEYECGSIACGSLRGQYKKTFSHAFFEALKTHQYTQAAFNKWLWLFIVFGRPAQKSTVPYHANTPQIKKRAAPEVRMAGWQPNALIPMRFYGLEKRTWQFSKFAWNQIARGSCADEARLRAAPFRYNQYPCMIEGKVSRSSIWKEHRLWTLDARNARGWQRFARCFRDAKPWIRKHGREGGYCCASEMNGCYKHDAKKALWRRNCSRMETVEDEWCKGCLRSRYCEDFFCMSKWDSNHDGWAIWSCFCFWCLDLFVHCVAFGSKVLMLEMLRGRMRRRRNAAGRSPEQGEPLREKRRRRREEEEERTAVNLQHKKIKTQVKTSLCSRSRRNHAWWMPWQRRRWETSIG